MKIPDPPEIEPGPTIACAGPQLPALTQQTTPGQSWPFVVATTVAGGAAGVIFETDAIRGFRFPICFTFIATIAGISWAFRNTRKRIQGFGAIAHLLRFLAFPLAGSAYSYFLAARFETPATISEIPVYQIVVSLAVGLFTSLFCSMAGGMTKHIRNAIPYAVMLAIPLVLVVLPDGEVAPNHVVTASLCLVCYCCGLLGLFLLMSFLMADSFRNVLLNIILLIVLNVVLPMALPRTGKVIFVVLVAHLAVANLLFALRLYGAFRKRKNPGAKFTPRFDSTLARALFIAPLLANMSVVGFIASVVPYAGLTHYLRQKEFLSEESVEIGLCLGGAAAIVYSACFFFYDLLFPNIYPSTFTGPIPLWNTGANVLFLAAIGWFSSSALAWSFARHEKSLCRVPGAAS